MSDNATVIPPLADTRPIPGEKNAALHASGTHTHTPAGLIRRQIGLGQLSHHAQLCFKVYLFLNVEFKLAVWGEAFMQK